MIRLLAAAATLLALGQAHAETVVIEHATIITEPGKRLKNASLLIVDGKIKAIGPQIKVPAAARHIDGTNKIVTAGLIATSSQIGMAEVGAVEYTNEGQFSAKQPIHAAFQVTDGYNPDSIVIPVTRNGGITSTLVAPSGGLVSGQSSWLSLGTGTTRDNLVKASTALHATLGRSSVAVGDGSRGLALQRLRALFEDADHYRKNKAAYHRGQTRKYAADHRQLEALQLVLDRKIPLVVNVRRKSDIIAVMGLAQELSIRIVLEGATEAWMLADKIAKAKIPVITNPKANLPRSFDETRVVDDNVTRLAKAGVQVIIASSRASSSARALKQLAGLAVAHGLSWQQAFAAITTTPASVFGVERGRLQKGAVADLVVWSGDPLEMSGRAERIFIAGVEQSKVNHQTQLLDRYQHR